MSPNPACWFEIYVQDMARAKEFCQTVLQVELCAISVEELEMWSFPSDTSTYGSCGALVRIEGFPSGGNSTLVYLGCEDCAVDSTRVKSAGGKLVREKFSIGEHGFVALAEDTEGNIFGLYSRA